MSGRCTGLRFRGMLSYAEIYAQEWEREFGRAVIVEPVLTHLNTFPLRTQRVRENIKRHREERRRRFWEEWCESTKRPHRGSGGRCGG